MVWVISFNRFAVSCVITSHRSWLSIISSCCFLCHDNCFVFYNLFLWKCWIIYLNLIVPYVPGLTLLRSKGCISFSFPQLSVILIKATMFNSIKSKSIYALCIGHPFSLICYKLRCNFCFLLSLVTTFVLYKCICIDRYFLVGWLGSRSADWFVHLMVSWLVCLLVSYSVAWLITLLVDFLACWLICRLVSLVIL